MQNPASTIILIDKTSKRSIAHLIFHLPKGRTTAVISSYRDGSVRFTSKGELVFPQRMPPVVENVITIERQAVHPTSNDNALSWPVRYDPRWLSRRQPSHGLHADQVLGIVTVTSLQPVGMAYYHHVPCMRNTFRRSGLPRRTPPVSCRAASFSGPFLYGSCVPRHRD